MRNFTKFILLILLTFGLGVEVSFGQSIMQPTDTVVNYNAAQPPTGPPAGQIGKWVRTPRLSWNTSSYKCYIYNGVCFRLKFPKSYNPTANDGKRYPMLLFFHGMGEAGPVTDNEYQLYHGGDVFSAAVDNGNFDGYVLAMQSTGGWGQNHYVFLASIIDYMIANNKLDPFRISDNGLSEGGYASWDMTISHPSYIAASLPMSGTGVVYTDPNNINIMKYTPFWNFQGGLDGSPAPNTAHQVRDAMVAAGGNFKYTEYADLGHGTWDRVWTEPDFYPFMLRAYSSNPWPLTGRTSFCPGDVISVNMGVPGGFNSYQWSKNGVVINGATTNTYRATDTGTYAAKVLKGTVWSDWSRTPVRVFYNPPTVTPAITVNGISSIVLPSPDNSAGAALMEPAGYATYLWQKDGSSTSLGTGQFFTAPSPGNYKAQVTVPNGCSTSFSPLFKVIDANGPNKPDPAAGLIVTTVSNTALRLDWNQNPSPVNNETNFEIYQATGSGGPYKLVAITGADVARDTLTGLTANTKYYYIIRAVNATGASAVSPEANGGTSADTKAPTAPTGVAISGTTRSSITLSWAAATDDIGVTKYDIFINGAKSYSTPGTQTSFTIPELTYGSSYSFAVKAEDQAGNISILSNQIVGQPLLSGLTYKYYENVTTTTLPDFNSLTPVSTGTMPNVSISPAVATSNYGFLWTGYIIIPTTGNYTFKTNSDDGSRLYLGALNGTASPYSFTATPTVDNDGLHGAQDKTSTTRSLTKGIYPIAVTFFQQGGGASIVISWKTPSSGSSYVTIPNSAFSDAAQNNGSAPAIPTNILATGLSYNSIRVNWTDKSNNETGFEVYRSNGLSAPFNIIATTASGVTSYIDSVGLQPATKYYYKVQAINLNGASGFDPASSAGVAWSYYSGTWSLLPDFSTLTPVATGQLNNVSLSPALATTNYAFKFQGTITIPRQGSYTFYTSSDDGSNLYIGGLDAAHLVVNNNFLQGTTERSGTKTLSPGTYSYYVTYFQQGGGAVLTTSWAGPGITKSAIPDSVLANANSSASTLALPAAPGAPTTPVLSGVTSSSIGLSWSANSPSITGFNVYRSNGDSLNFIKIAATAANVTSFTDTGLFSNQKYYYKVNASWAGGVSGYTAAVSATTRDILPVMTKLSDRSVRYGTTTVIPVSATTVNSGGLVLSGPALPGFAQLTDNGNGSGSLTLNPASSDQAVYLIKLRATDVFGGADSTVFNLTVNDNYDPTVDTVINYTLNENDTLSIPLSAHDQNAGDNLTFTISGGINGSVLTPGANGMATLLLHPDYASAGVYTIQVKVSDGKGGTVTRQFVVTVKDKDPSTKIYARILDADPVGAPWNNISGLTNSNFKDANGNQTTVGVAFQTTWYSTYHEGPVTGNNSGMFPDAVLNDYYYCGIFGGPDSVSAKITGLDTSKVYNISLYGGSVWSGASNSGTTYYRIGSTVIPLYVQGNNTKTADFNTLKPAADGTITFWMRRGSDAPAGFLNAVIISQQYDDGTAPATPKSLTAQLLTGKGVQLGWTDVAYNETGVEVWRAAAPSTTFSLLGQTAANTGAYIDSTTVGNTQYYYKVRSINGHGNSAFTDSVSITTQRQTLKLNAIADIAVKVNQTVTVTVTGIDDVNAGMVLKASNLPPFVTFADNGNGTGTLTVSPTDGTVGVYSGATVTASDNSDSSVSDQFSIYVTEQNVTSTYINFTDGVTMPGKPWNSVLGIPFAGTVLSNLVNDANVPTGVSLTLQDGWQGVIESGMRPRNGKQVYPEAVMRTGEFDGGSGSKRILISGLSSTLRYNFVFFNSHDDALNGNTNFTINGKTVTLNATYNINKTVQINGVAANSSGQVTITVAKGTSADYIFLSSLIIQAYDSTVNNLLGPTDLRVTAQDKKSITLQWQDRTNNETNYEVWRAPDGSTSYTLLTTLAAATTTYTDANLTSDKTYSYVVRAKKTTTYSSYSNIATGYTYASTVYVNFNNTSVAASPWNNLNSVPQVGTVWSSFLNDAGIGTNLGLVETGQWDGLYGAGVQTGNNSGVYPDAVLLESYGVFAGGVSTVKVTGLNFARHYDFTFNASATGVQDANAEYSVGSQTSLLNASSNKSATTTIYNIVPDQNGEALITIRASAGSQLGLIGALVINGFTPSVNSVPTAPRTTAVTTTARLTQGASFNLDDSTGSDLIVTAYPNPFDQSFVLSVGSKGDDRATVLMYDMSGRTVYAKQVAGLVAGKNIIQVEPGNIPAGIYFIKILFLNDRSRVETKKLIKR